MRRSAEDRRTLATLAAEYERVRDAEPYRVPPAFIFRATRHLEATGEPLLKRRYGRVAYRETVLAVSQGDDYELTLEGYDEVPFATWREYAAWREIDEEAVLDEHGLDPDQLDDEIPDPYALLDDAVGTTTGKVYALLESLGVPRAFACPEMPEVALGGLEFIDGSCPGNDYCGVAATSPMALACLQYVLDDLRAGVRLQLHSY